MTAMTNAHPRRAAAPIEHKARQAAPAGRAWRVGPIARISLGLCSLLASLALVSDLWLGAMPGRADVERQVRQRVAENLSHQLISLLEAGDTPTLGKTIQQVLARDPSIRSISVQRQDGSMLLQRGAFDGPAQATARPVSTLDQVRVPILAGRVRWGEIVLKFKPADPPTLASWLAQPMVQWMAVMGLGSLLLFYAYLRRAMQYLNPSASVPDRVRKALDALTEGLLIIDQQARIVLANKAFRQLHPEAAGDLNGRAIDRLGWLGGGAQDSPAAPAAWWKTLRTAATVTAEPLTVHQPTGEPTRLLVSSAAITDLKGRARGCLITFDNVTAVHRVNEELRATLSELERSREHIEQQNDALKRLAQRDPMTGCFNRRAFFETAGALFEQARRDQAPLCCLMADIDHFKQFNDVYGHAVGDQVIQVVARSLSSGLRQPDVLCRYGGEEFCIVLPGATPEEALAVAERIRIDIEDNARGGVRGTEVMPITASFGLATLALGAATLEELIDHADQALYASKKAGRNRVTAWQRPG